MTATVQSTGSAGVLARSTTLPLSTNGGDTPAPPGGQAVRGAVETLSTAQPPNPNPPAKESNKPSTQIDEKYARYTSEVSVRNSRVACGLVIALMPAGIVLDYVVYHDQLS